MDISKATRLAQANHQGITRVSSVYASGRCVVYPTNSPLGCILASWDAKTNSPYMGSQWVPRLEDFLARDWYACDYPNYPSQQLTDEIKDQYKAAISNMAYPDNLDYISGLLP